VRNLPRAARHATYGARSRSSAGQIWLVLAFPRRVEQGQSKTGQAIFGQGHELVSLLRELPTKIT
jgi:hypothetical protein